MPMSPTPIAGRLGTARGSMTSLDESENCGCHGTIITDQVLLTYGCTWSGHWRQEVA
ncbi:hypothetical protein POX_e07198 [Penicillium oxalicum]|uniref:Uncharacterized protein n=1 Tax=Penicillium oxalicum (strain 114-2 / CGMCC 5302) TaxID=933388 RepID=S8AQI9_PENO1|nr:hypothetical protein POX_e07198 [Penicillium oxalicum]EPS28228.1 hypothetical protein PDE_03174 [Penicillium oxalicum 114-2]KAI2789170.1 hypothetical protein POX_e07198 [Penicillium oxalicum]